MHLRCGRIYQAIVLSAFHIRVSIAFADRRPSLLQTHTANRDPRRSSLLIDLRGPTRVSGDGVRLASLVMDLTAAPCNFKVDVVTREDIDVEDNWGASVAEEYFSGVKILKNEDLPQGKILMSAYGRILLGAKLELFQDSPPTLLSSAVQQLRDLKTSGAEVKAKVSVLFDDDPFIRCHFRPDADALCANVEGTVRELATLSHEFVVLTVNDRTSLRSRMKSLNLNVSIKVWPMQLQNMERLLPSQRFVAPKTSAEASKLTYVAMMGNPHVVNAKMVSILFESGAVKQICASVDAIKSEVKLLFLGGIASLVEQYVKAMKDTSRCVKYHIGTISEKEFAMDVQPKIRAMLNPFFEDVDSGISVKTFEGLMSRVPVITSTYGMHGLADEIPACGHFPVPRDPANPAVFAKFISDNIINETSFMTFSSAFQEHADACINAQRAKYTHEDACPKAAAQFSASVSLPRPA